MGISLRKATDIDLADFCRFDPVPPEGIARALAIMQSGEIFRYSNSRAEESEATLLEHDFAKYVGAKYALGVNSCSTAIQLALTACGTHAGSKVLVPGFTFTAVPSAIVLLGAIPVFVECTEDYRIDLDDLQEKITRETKVLLLSHMRGCAPDMDRVTSICAEHNITLIEDAAHALGGRWRGRHLGSFGKIGCYSFQSNKIINAGEGGMIVTDDEETIVKAIYLSGSYESNYQKHLIQSSLFEDFQGKLPAHNMRMTNVTAAMARPQVALVDRKGACYRTMYACLKQELSAIDPIEFPNDNPNEIRVPDSIQFRVSGFGPLQMDAFIARVREKGVPLAGFAEHNNARAYYNWRYLDVPSLPRTHHAIANACDLRLSSALTQAHLSYLASVIRSAVHAVKII